MINWVYLRMLFWFNIIKFFNVNYRVRRLEENICVIILIEVEKVYNKI